LSADGNRTILDAAAERLTIDPVISFEEKFNKLENIGGTDKGSPRISVLALTPALN
jgi:hypothetical protein